MELPACRWALRRLNTNKNTNNIIIPITAPRFLFEVNFALRMLGASLSALQGIPTGPTQELGKTRLWMFQTAASTLINTDQITTDDHNILHTGLAGFYSPRS